MSAVQSWACSQTHSKSCGQRHQSWALILNDLSGKRKIAFLCRFSSFVVPPQVRPKTDFLALFSIHKRSSCAAELTWWNLSLCGGAKALKYSTGGSTQTRKLSIIWLGFQLMHTLFLLEGLQISFGDELWALLSGSRHSFLHTRVNLKKQVNCGSLPP